MKNLYNIGDSGYITNWIKMFNKELKKLSMEILINKKSDKIVVETNLRIDEKSVRSP